MSAPRLTLAERPRLLDLFCGAGGAAKGYQRAGFYVVGVDIKPQPRYCGDEFVQADALAFAVDHWRAFDAVHASPPCQAFCALRHLQSAEYPNLIDATRAVLQSFTVPYVIENVTGAPLKQAIQLCGSSFGLGVRRHRIFESDVLLLGSQCAHDAQGRPVGVHGTGGRRRRFTKRNKGGNANAARTLAEAREAIGMPWADRYGISQAIPPAFTEYIGRQLLEAIQS
jgi:DNA (cytosine-5)-methyltransferase 1